MRLSETSSGTSAYTSSHHLVSQELLSDRHLPLATITSINSLKNLGYVAFDIQTKVDVRTRKQIVEPSTSSKPKRVRKVAPASESAGGLQWWQASLLGAIVAGLTAWTVLAYYPL